MLGRGAIVAVGLRPSISRCGFLGAIAAVVGSRLLGQVRGRARRPAPSGAQEAAQAVPPIRGRCWRFGLEPPARPGLYLPVMPSFQHGAVEIAYLDEGEGEPIVLVHGFASNKEVNWVQPGWVATLTRAGRRVIALDNRGHGQSTKLYDPADYHTGLMAGDVARADRASRPRARRRDGLFDGRAHRAPFWRSSIRSACARVILGGLGIKLVDGAGLPESIADALEAPSVADVTDPRAGVPRLRRSDQIGPPRARRLHPRLAPDHDARAGGRRSQAPVLIAVGTKDDDRRARRRSWPR